MNQLIDIPLMYAASNLLLSIITPMSTSQRKNIHWNHLQKPNEC